LCYISVHLDYARIIVPQVYIAMAATRKLQGKEICQENTIGV